MEIDKLKKVICGNKNVSANHLKQLSAKLTEETTNTSVVNDLTKLLPAVLKYAVHQDKAFREAALPALNELGSLLDLNKHLKEMPWWTETKDAILTSVDVLMNLVTTGDDQWAELWMTIVMILGSDLRAELTLLNRLLKVVEKAFKMNDENIRYQGFECWCKLIDNFSINKQEINNKRRLGLLIIPLKANNHNTPRLCAAKMKTWKHILSKLDQHSEMTVDLLITHFLEFMFRGVGSIAPACKTLNTECASVFSQMLQTPLPFRIVPDLFIRYSFVCIEHVHRDLTLCMNIWESVLENMKHNQWSESHVTELLTCLTNASKTDKLGKSKTFAHMVRSLYSGKHQLPLGTQVKHLKTIMAVALEPHVLVNYAEDWYNELLNIVAETDHIQLPQSIIGDIISKLNVLAVSEQFRDEKLKFLRGMWILMTNIICKWMSDGGQIGKNGNAETDLQDIHQLLFFGAAPLSSTWNKLQMKSWKTLYSECVKYFSLSTEVKCEKFVGDLVELLLEGVRDKKIPLHIALDLVSIVLEYHLAKDESSVLPLMMEVAVGTMNSFQTDTVGAYALLSQYLKIIVVAARTETALVNDILTVVDKMLTLLDDFPLAETYLEKTRNAIMKVQIQLNGLKPCRSQDRSESPSTNHASPVTSPTMTSFLHRLAKSKETKSKISSPTPSQSSDISSPNHTPNSKKSASPFCDMKSEDFVFVPPKPRKILLTEHQKESLTTRKHDIPALYQDLSQDSSQSAFESIITPAHVVEKEQKTEKEPVSHSPQNFKDINFTRMSPRKSQAANLKSPTKLQNNKENDCLNNNTKSPVKTKESKLSGVTEEIPLKVLQEDQKKVQDDVSEDLAVSKLTATYPQMRLRKSLSNDSVSNQIINGAEEDAKNDDKVKDADSVLDREHIQLEETASSNENKLKDTEQNLSTPKHSVEDKTPKRSLRKTKLSISIEKSGQRSGKRSIQKEETEKDKSTSSSSTNKSLNSNTTPKISPRRLRNRKSGVTPVLSGGGLIKKTRGKTQSPKDTPTNKNTKNNTPVSTKSDTCIENKNCKEIIQVEEEKQNNRDDITSDIKRFDDQGQCDPDNKAEKIKVTSNTNKEDCASKSVAKNAENHINENETNDIEIIAVIKKDKDKLNVSQNKKGSFSRDLLLKNLGSSKTDVSCLDLTCSPVKVVVERLPEMGLSSKFENQEKRDSTVLKTDTEKQTTAVRNILSSLSASNHNLNCGTLDVSCKSVQSEIKANIEDEKYQSTFVLELDETRKEETRIELQRDNIDITSNEDSTPSKKKNTTEEVDSEIKTLGNCRKTRSIGTVENPSPITPKDILDETRKEETHIELQRDNTDITTNEESQKDGSNKKNKTTEEAESEIKILGHCRKTRSIGTVEKPSLITPKDIIDSETTSEKKPIDEDDADLKSSTAEKMSSESTSKTIETNISPSILSKPKSTECTPVKSGQKQLKQTQLPFTPIRKTKLPVEEEQTVPSKLEEVDGKSPLLVLKKIETSETTKALESSKSKTENKIISNVETMSVETNKSLIKIEERKTVECKSADDVIPTNSIKGSTEQEVQRTPEKANTSKNVSICLQKCDDARVPARPDSPCKTTESEDIIASSQENDVTTQSILSCRNSSGSLKLLSKSPKKCDSSSQSIVNSERVLRSSPSKAENTRSTVTPVKKSVCRRLDVEIEESPEYDDLACLTSTIKTKSSASVNLEEQLSDDFRLLNGDYGNQKTTENGLPSNRELEVAIASDDVQDAINCSPKSHKSPNRKRIFVELEGNIGSPKRTIGSLRFENNSSPVSSPTSRTSQMMELAKQDRTVSSPISTKKRRVLPIRVGPAARQASIQRTHSGPSEEWVRRTYSPTASPNSSILKRTHQTPQLVSPDSSPPSSKKKRVSFLDPPVSESLLFSKVNPGIGHVQRTESRQDGLMDFESEDVPTQGSLEVEVPEFSKSEAEVFSPLKQCSSPLTDILERIANQQWMSELEAQLERLGVTTIGQLSSLPEETVQRLPFIPPKLDRLRKILQNYYNEINEKPVEKRHIGSEANRMECLSSGKKSSKVEVSSPKKNVEDIQSQSEENTELGSPEDVVSSAEKIKQMIEQHPALSPKKTAEKPQPENKECDRLESQEDVASIAEHIREQLHQHPELVHELGNLLEIDVVMKLLDVAVAKMKKQIDKS
ncbi:telomere-associated protein RIF1 [Macrosteles quadrilineatus]|uniref:telomere-associated protein RIF1 n=1 Tax=Macrosteles quadrilineatus TaxID=74068 RepID=UPI0023E289B9|nr:telomere-associated protein RIF1 [Macrosteles quadrilineatus]